MFSSSVHHQEFFTVHTAMVYVIQVFRQHVRWIRLISLIQLTCCLKTCVTYTIAVCTVKNSWQWTEELSETCRVSFWNKFEKLVRLDGFIIRNMSLSLAHAYKYTNVHVLLALECKILFISIVKFLFILIYIFHWVSRGEASPSYGCFFTVQCKHLICSWIIAESRHIILEHPFCSSNTVRFVITQTCAHAYILP